MSVRLLHGDCLDLLRDLPDNSVDSVVCDPPYGLGFLDRKWDAPGLEWAHEWAVECHRVLKPGGHLVAFGGTRTVHRLAVAIEDGGFDIRDTISWLYWTGFPKSLDVSKAIDASKGAEREVVGTKLGRPGMAKDGSNQRNGFDHAFGGEAAGPMPTDITAPATDLARQWSGWGTALKPAQEPAILARKPLDGTVAGNVERWGTGGLNIDGCRYGYGDLAWPGPQDVEVHAHPGRADVAPTSWTRGGDAVPKDHPDSVRYAALGRWPANIYACPKASRAEREAGCEGLPAMGGHEAVDRAEGSAGLNSPRAGAGRTASEVRNLHPTVKPIALMRWLCRLVTPPGGVVLDTFMGSGTTGIAAVAEGFDFIGMEREAPYMKIAAARIGYWHPATRLTVPPWAEPPAPVQATLWGAG